MTSQEIIHNTYQRTVQDLMNLYEKGQLNLNPGFQRQSVWNKTDREKLIDSIIRNYAIPAIFFYRRIEKGKITYDVIDGKQRIETIFLYTGVLKGGRFEAKLQLPGSDIIEKLNWNQLKRKEIENLITGYNIYIIEVDGSFNNIIDLFVRINSTGKALTSAEKQHAKFYNSNFLRTAAKVARKYESNFKVNNIISAGQVSRMKHVELVCEIMISLLEGGVLNKKASLNRVMEKDSYTTSQIIKVQEKTIKAINRVNTLFPLLKTSRFRQLSDYYILVCLIAQYEVDGLILIDKKKLSLHGRS